jgi:hypothetical protein
MQPVSKTLVGRMANEKGDLPVAFFISGFGVSTKAKTWTEEHAGFPPSRE